MGGLLALLAVILCQRTSHTGNDNLRKWMLSRDKGSCAIRQPMVPISFEYGLFKRELLCLSDSENRQVCCSPLEQPISGDYTPMRRVGPPG